MELNKGYKQTEVGVIPDDWEVKVLDREIDLLTGFPFPSNKYSEAGIRLLRGSNVKRGETDWSENITQYWEQLTPELKAYLLQDGDIVIAMDGSLVGRSFARLSKTDLPALLLQRVARVRSYRIELGYLKEFICSDYFTKYCDSVKTVSAIPHISPGDIRNFKIPLPPTKAEQTAIATALSDADALISSLEKLIEKKRNIKQGAMQQLLKPKKGWVTKKLGDVFEISAGGDLDKSNFVEYQDDKYLYPVYSNSLSNKGLYGYTSIYTHEENTITVTARGTVGNANFRNHKYSAIGRVLILKPKQELDCPFLTDCINNKITFANESTGVPQLTAPQISNYEVCIPTYFEQKSISEIHQDLDNEITSLEKKLSKSKMLKQGMMQELLTGKIRLV